MDHTAPFQIGHSTIVVPLLLETDIWSIAYPLSDDVWYALIISMPVFLGVMALADYVYLRKINWTALFGFVMRNVLSEYSEMPYNKRANQKILIIVWVASIFVLVRSFSGNLTAMLTAPGLPNTIRNSEEFLAQKELSLVIPKKTFTEHIFKYNPPGLTEKSLGERASVTKPLTPTELLKYGCYTTEQYNYGKNAAICIVGSFYALISYDYSRTGQCNFYRTNDKFVPTLVSVGAFQVWYVYIKYF